MVADTSNHQENKSLRYSKNMKKFIITSKECPQECVICMEQFKEEEEVAELKCDERHYFHINCLEDWLKRKMECPLCKSTVKPES